MSIASKYSLTALAISVALAVDVFTDILPLWAGASLAALASTMAIKSVFLAIYYGL